MGENYVVLNKSGKFFIIDDYMDSDIPKQIELDKNSIIHKIETNYEEYDFFNCFNKHPMNSSNSERLKRYKKNEKICMVTLSTILLGGLNLMTDLV